MKRISTLCLTLLTAIIAFAATPTAESILGSMRKSMLAKPAVEAKFTINGGQGPVQGTICIEGAKFAMATPQLKVWYDGKTQWTYLASTGEVSITEPTADELAASNPFAILSGYETRYKARKLTDSNGRRRVELQPRAKDTGFEKIIVIADTAGKWPQAINIYFDDGRQISLVIDHITGAARQPDRIFRYDPKLQPASEIIDLR